MYTTIGALTASPGASGSGIYPSIIDTTFTQQTSAPFRAAMPGNPATPGVGISAGQLLIMLITQGSGADPNATPSGWVQLIAGDFHAFYKWAIGNEGGTAVTVGFAGASTPGFAVIRVHGASSAQNPQATVFTGSGTSLDPPSLTTAWTASNSLFMTYAGTSDPKTLASSGYPSGYSLSQSANSSANTSAFVAAKQLASPATENPGAFTITTSVAFYRAITIAVKGT